MMYEWDIFVCNKPRCSTKMRLDGWMNNTIDPEDVNDDDIDGDEDDHEL